MKTTLTVEQSAKLIELGVDLKLASSWVKYCERSSDNSPCPNPIFTLTDILSILPSEIYSEERDIIYSLTMIKQQFGSVVCYEHPAYPKGFGPKKQAPELIDALYQLLIWTIKNKHANSNL